MVKIVKSTTTTKYTWDKTNYTKYTEVIEQYNYDSKEERDEHAKNMIKNGFKDSGQVQENIGTFHKPEHVWFGSYYKTVRG